MAETQAKIRNLKIQLEAITSKRRMIVKLSPNSKFTTIGDIQRAGSDEKIEEVGSEASDEDSSIALCIVVEN